jgi:hypothetical protein
MPRRMNPDEQQVFFAFLKERDTSRRAISMPLVRGNTSPKNRATWDMRAPFRERIL